MLEQTDDAVGGDLDGEGRGGEKAVAGAEPVAYDAVDDEGAVDFSGRGEAFAAGKIAPFFRRDDAGGFEPFVAGIHVGSDVGSGGGGGADARGTANTIENFLAESVDEVEVGAHALAHDFRGDVDHVGVTHVAAVDDVGHLHAGARARWPGPGRRRWRPARFPCRRGPRRACRRGARGEVFQNEGVPRAADARRAARRGRRRWTRWRGR